MNNDNPSAPPPDGEPEYTLEDLSDINELAVKQFIRLIQSDQSLAPEWKEEMLRMLKQGVPEDISSLENLIMEDVDATTEETRCTELPRNY